MSFFSIPDSLKKLHFQAGIASFSFSTILGRVLLALTGILLLVMPWTERVSAWDDGFRGSRDWEFGLLGLAGVLCLALLLPHWCKQSLLLHLTTCRLARFHLKVARRVAASLPCGAAVCSFRKQTTGPPLGIRTLPLLI